VDFKVTVVFNEAQLPKFVHEVTDTRPCGANHFRKRFLADFPNHLLRNAILAEIRE
jgi:hypothetical protein